MVPLEVSTGTRYTTGYGKADPYYIPSEHGHEAEVWRRLRELWGGEAEGGPVRPAEPPT